MLLLGAIFLFSSHLLKNNILNSTQIVLFRFRSGCDVVVVGRGGDEPFFKGLLWFVWSSEYKPLRCEMNIILNKKACFCPSVG